MLHQIYPDHAIRSCSIEMLGWQYTNLQLTHALQYKNVNGSLNEIKLFYNQPGLSHYHICCFFYFTTSVYFSVIGMLEMVS